MEPYRYLGLLRGGAIGRAAGGRALNAMVNCGVSGKRADRSIPSFVATDPQLFERTFEPLNGQFWPSYSIT